MSAGEASMSHDESRPRKAPEGYRTRPEQAYFLGKDEKTIEKWDRERTGPAVTYIGKTPVYRKATTDEWLLSQERQQVRAGKRRRPVFAGGEAR
jgi:hypothetical protein